MENMQLYWKSISESLHLFQSTILTEHLQAGAQLIFKINFNF